MLQRSLFFASLLAHQVAAENVGLEFDFNRLLEDERMLEVVTTAAPDGLGDDGKNVGVGGDFQIIGDRSSVTATVSSSIRACVTFPDSGTSGTAATHFEAYVRTTACGANPGPVVVTAKCVLTIPTATHICASGEPLQVDAAIAVAYAQVVDADVAAVQAKFDAVDDFDGYIADTGYTKQTVSNTIGVTTTDVKRSSTLTTVFDMCVDGEAADDTTKPTAAAIVANVQATIEAGAGTGSGKTFCQLVALKSEVDGKTTTTCATVVTEETTTKDDNCADKTQVKVTNTIEEDTTLTGDVAITLWKAHIDTGGLGYAGVLDEISPNLKTSFPEIEATTIAAATKLSFAVEDTLTPNYKAKITTTVSGCAKKVGDIGDVQEAFRGIVDTKVCGSATVLAISCDVSIAQPASGACGLSRRGRQLTEADLALAADVDIVIDTTEEAGRELSGTVETYIKDTAATEVAAAALVDVNFDDTFEPTATATAPVIVDDTPTTTGSTSTTSSGAATMFVGHIGALLATYLYVSL